MENDNSMAKELLTLQQMADFLGVSAQVFE